MTNKQFKWAIGSILFALLRIAYVILNCTLQKYDVALNHIRLMDDSREKFLSEFNEESDQ